MVALNRSYPSRPHLEHTRRSPSRFSETQLATVLFATDLSETSRNGLKLATAIAQCRGAKLILLHVVELPTPSEDLLFEELRPHRIKAKARLHTFVPQESDVPFIRKVVYGDPVTEIVSMAELEKVSLIIVGTHQRRGLHRLLTGSIAESILRRSPCPVLAFPQESTRMSTPRRAGS